MSTKINLYKQTGTDTDTKISFNVPRSLTYGLNARANDDGGVSEADNCTYNTLNGINTLLSSASLMLTPSSYKEGKLYSVIPSNGNGDFTVTRATTATRVNSDGLVELVPYNLLTYSQDYTNASWLKSGITISANVITSPNGSVNASKLVENGALVEYGIYKGITNGFIYSHSIYAKKAERDWIKVNPIAGANKSVWFNLANGTIGTNNSGAPATIESVGNGWYRCIVNGANHLTGASFFSVMPCTNNNVETYTGTSGSGVYVWGAQLVEGTNALPYQKTETRLNIPRLDYSLGGCPNILLEPQRTNLALQSSSFDSATWLKTNSSSASNTATSPSGIQDADTFIGDGTLNVHQIQQPLTVVNSTAYTWSIYAKKNTNNFIQLTGYDSGFGATAFANFDLNNGVVGSVGSGATASIQNVGNGWYRCIITMTSISTSTGIQVYLVSSETSVRKESNTLSTSVFLWGAQFEAGAYATSYIPTTTASVTRNADLCSKTGITSLIGQTEGTIYWDGNLSVNASERRLLSITGTAGESQRIIIWTLNNILYTTFNVVSVNLGSFPIGTTKIAIGYTISGANTTYSIKVNNNTLVTGTAAAAPTSLSSIALGSQLTASLTLNDRINSTILWKERLTNDQLEALTGQGFDTYAAMASYYNYTLQ